MPYSTSDEESSDSDNGVRFKTTNVRDKFKITSSNSAHSTKSCSHEYKPNFHVSSYKNSKHKDILKDDCTRTKHAKRENKRNKECTRQEINVSRNKDKKYMHNDTSHKRKRDSKELKDISITNKGTAEVNTSDIVISGASSSIQKIISKEINSSTCFHKLENKDTCKNILASPQKHIKIDNTISHNVYFGPTLPKEKHELQDVKCNEEDNICFGPSLPPKVNSSNENKKSFNKNNDAYIKLEKFEKKDSCNIIGPILPEHLRQNIDNTIEETKINISDSEDDTIGPMPAERSRNTELEERALQIKLNILNKTDTESTSREEWMLELPEINSVGPALKQRKFRTKDIPDFSDRSMWTDTPKNKSKKNNIKVQSNSKNEREKNSVQEKIVAEHKKNKRSKSLIDLHNEELRKKQLETQSLKERRPFSRDIDLKNNRIDESYSKRIIKNSQLLNDRFSSGHSKFL